MAEPKEGSHLTISGDEKRKYNLLIGATGSVASMKMPILLSKLKELPLEIAVVGTENSFHFFDRNELAASHGEVQIYRDHDEWRSWNRISDPVLHIELRKWADIFLIAPLDANTMSKIAFGLCDNLLTCITRAWDLRKPLIFCPAMNTFMWEHPATQEAIEKLKSWGYTEVPVVSKRLACGDVGAGAMAEVDTIVEHVRSLVFQMPKS